MDVGVFGSQRQVPTEYFNLSKGTVSAAFGFGMVPFCNLGVRREKLCNMGELQRITINPNQCGGRPCVRGMRIRVKDVLDMLSGGATQERFSATFRTSKLKIFAPASPTLQDILTRLFSPVKQCDSLWTRNFHHRSPGGLRTEGSRRLW